MTGFFASLTNFLSRFALLVMVAPWEQAIRVRGGRSVRRLPCGFHFLIPVFDTVHKQTVRRRNSLLATQTLTTADGHTLVVGASLGYQIADIERLYQSLHDAEDTLGQIAAAALAEAVLGRSKEDLTPRRLGEQLTATMATTMEGFGLSDVDVRVTDFAYIRAFRLVMDQRWGTGGGLAVDGAQRQ